MMLSDSLFVSSQRQPGKTALTYKSDSLTYEQLVRQVEQAGRGFLELGLSPGDRIGIYLAKQFETVVAIYGAAVAGGVFIPLNPTLRRRQVGYILRDCNIRILVTSPDRLAGLTEELPSCPDLRSVILVEDNGEQPEMTDVECLKWDSLIRHGRDSSMTPPSLIDSDMAALLYTSGSTGMPKGVVLSHGNLVVGAQSVCQYLDNSPDDRILAVPPLSFDYGLSQVTTGFHVGATVVLMNYLFPKDVVTLLAAEDITGLPCVPPLWIQLAKLDWPAASVRCLRYATSTGGRMPVPIVEALRSRMPKAEFFIMYGLTEAFRSTYLPPGEIDDRPESIGKAIPNAEIMIVGDDGQLCGPGQPGELVHRGPLVSQGYWNDPERTAERFKPAPGRPDEIPIKEIAVWSGDTVTMDEDGYLYFIGRRDDMIKTAGCRVSPTEVEEVVYASGLAAEAVAVGAPHPELGEGIVLLYVPAGDTGCDEDAVVKYCRGELPTYMVPHVIISRSDLPRNVNGKINRKLLTEEVVTVFAEAEP